MTEKEEIKGEIIRRNSIRDGKEQYTYFLIKRESEISVGLRLSLYSIRVELEEEDCEISHCEISNVFVNERKALSFFDRLVRNLATPINLPYAIEDALDCGLEI